MLLWIELPLKSSLLPAMMEIMEQSQGFGTTPQAFSVSGYCFGQFEHKSLLFGCQSTLPSFKCFVGVFCIGF